MLSRYALASMRQHQQPGWKVRYDPANDRIARLLFLKNIRNSTCLPVYGTDREWWPFGRETFYFVNQLR
jgi:hypothetical protein